MENIQADNAKQQNQMALFKIADETFGIAISTIREIVRMPDLTSVPGSPDYLSGLTNLRNRVLPVISVRTRLGLIQGNFTDSTRVLVVDTAGATTGIIVDRVTGVASIEDMKIESPPEILSSGIDRKFVKSVIKSGDGQKIIMEVDVNALCAIDENVAGSAADNQVTEQSQQAETIRGTLAIEEVQMVSFILSSEEYAFPIHVVSEVLRVGNITHVPKTPDYVLGILTVRNSVMPIIDNRKLFGLKPLIEELYELLADMEKQLSHWFSELKNAMRSGITFKQNLQADKSKLGIWLEHFRTVSEEIGENLQEMRYLNINLYNNARRMIATYQGKAVVETVFETQVQNVYNHLVAKFKDLREAIKNGIAEDLRIMVIEINKYPIGLLVDRVQQVLRVNKNTLEIPPVILSTDKSKIVASIAKINQGERIVMLLDEQHLLEQYKIDELNELRNRIDNKDNSNAMNNIGEEVQLVTFNLNNEQFALSIEEVQEINRIGTITAVPQAADFVEGVMNLRGNVIPVINLRKRFLMPEKEFNDATKVIIVTIMDRLTGLIVDSVSEVLRIPKKNIEPAPEIMKTGVSNDFLKGVGKVDATKKMLLLISTDKILTAEQKKRFIL